MNVWVSLLGQGCRLVNSGSVSGPPMIRILREWAIIQRMKQPSPPLAERGTRDIILVKNPWLGTSKRVINDGTGVVAVVVAKTSAWPSNNAYNGHQVEGHGRPKEGNKRWSLGTIDSRKGIEDARHIVGGVHVST